MPTLASPPLQAPAETISAAAMAAGNWSRNHRSLLRVQPTVAELLDSADISDRQWLFARDGSVTAMEPDGRWWGDCSVPLLAGRALLKTLQPGPAGNCLLLPGNAGLLVAARERINACSPLFVVQPDVAIARIILSCGDFSMQIDRHRLWFFTGPDWAQQLHGVFSEHLGLATPMQFIRTRLLAEEAITPLIAAAQEVFSTVLSERSDLIAELSKPATVSAAERILLIGGTEFRLWDDGVLQLNAQLLTESASSQKRVIPFDTDNPMNGSPIALLRAARDCGAIVSANICRADSNQLLPRDMPWISWMTHAGAPPFATAGPRDRLILADPAWRAITRQVGWPDDRVKICGWPTENVAPRVGDQNTELAMIVDTRRLEIPASVKQFSSHRLLWELIEEELHSNPLAVDKVEDYLSDRASQLNITGDGIDRRAFIQELILPAYRHGLARMLIEAGLPLVLWGQGWSDLEEFTEGARGPIANRAEFGSAVAGSAALVYCWPERFAHPIDTTGKPLVQRAGQDRSQFLRNAQRALGSTARKPPVSPAAHSVARIVLELIEP